MTASQIKRRALREVGDVGRDAEWEITLPQNTTGGVWSVAFVGTPSASLAALASAPTVQLALSAVPTILDGNVLVTGVPRGPFRIKFVGVLGAMPLPESLYPLTGNGAGLSPSAALTPIQIDPGESPVMTSIADELYVDLAAIPNEDTRRVKLKIALLETLLGGSHAGIDVETAGRVEHLAQQHSNLLELLDRARADLAEIIGVARVSSHSHTGAVSKITKTTPNGQPYGVLTRRGVL